MENKTSLNSYIGTYKTNNGCFIDVFVFNNTLVDQNFIKISIQELNRYIKLN